MKFARPASKEMPPPPPRKKLVSKAKAKAKRQLRRRDAIAGFVKDPRDLFKKSVRFSGHDNVAVFQSDASANTAATRSKWTSKAREEEVLGDSLEDARGAHKSDLVSRATDIDFEYSFNQMLREVNYKGRGKTCAAALAMGTVRKLARNADVAVSLSECLLELFKEQRLETELVSKIGDLCFAHKDAMTTKEQCAVRRYMLETL